MVPPGGEKRTLWQLPKNTEMIWTGPLQKHEWKIKNNLEILRKDLMPPLRRHWLKENMQHKDHHQPSLIKQPCRSFVQAVKMTCSCTLKLTNLYRPCK